VKQSVLLTAWKRTYYEYDPTYRVGSGLLDAAKAGAKTVTVRDATGFKVGDKVRILDSKGREPELRKITDIEGKVLTLDKPLTKSFAKWKSGAYGQTGYVGKESDKDPAKNFFLPDVSKLADTFDDAFVDFRKLQGDSKPVPYDYTSTTLAIFDFFQQFYVHAGKQKQDTFQLVGGPYSTLTKNSYAGVSDKDMNISVVFVQSDITKRDYAPAKNRDTTNHEICHQWDPGGIPNGGHNNLEAHDGSDKCLMNVGDPDTGKGARNDADDLLELSLDQIYKIRDRKDAI
jgi:hypothetical protein